MFLNEMKYSCVVPTRSDQDLKPYGYRVRTTSNSQMNKLKILLFMWQFLKK